jgi:hypothetical protein
MRRLFLSTLIVFAASCIAAAQTSTKPPSPPNTLLIVREEIKPGKMIQHEKEAMQYVNVQARANARLPMEAREGRLAMSPIGGNENEVMYLSAYDSMADMEKVRKENEKLAIGAMKVDYDALPSGESHESQMDMVARLRPDLSYNMGKIDVAQARYMSATTLRLKPGTEDEYWEKVKSITWAARDKAGFPGSLAVYEVMSGAPGTTYIIFRPLKSLAELDAAPNAVRNEMGSGGRKDLDNIREKSVMYVNNGLYAFNPRISIVSAEFAARDTTSPAFWITNPQMPAPAVTARSAKRKAKP